MNRSSLAALAIAWAFFGCAHAPGHAEFEPATPVPDVRAGAVEQPTDPPTEAEVRAFLDAEADELAADRQADAAADDAANDVAAGAAHPADSESNPLGIVAADFDLPIVYNERVQFWLDYFQTRHRDLFARYLARMGRYEPFIRERLRQRGMPEDLIYLALIESGFSPVVRSRASAVGLWQFVAGTGRRYGLEISRYVDDRRDPIKATDAALDYLEDLHERFGSWYLAAAAYNTGENRVERILREKAGGARGADSLFWTISGSLFSETRNYIPKLLAAAILSKYRNHFGFDDVVPETPDAFDTVTVPDATDLDVIAKAAGVPANEIKALNPQFLRGLTPPGRSARVRVPAGRAETFAVAYARIPPSQRVRVLEHLVRSGETLSHIARRYGTTVLELQRLNRIDNPRSLRAGRTLVVSLRGGAAASTLASAAPVPSRGTTPASPKAAASSAAAADTLYRIRPGDSLWSIARRNGVTVDELRAWNELGPDDAIVAGRTLRVRGPDRVIVYRVQAGDTLWGIARRHGLTADRLVEWNRLDRNGVLRPGDEVEVPVSR